MPSLYSTNSPYFSTPQRNFIIEFLDFLEFREIPSDPSDEIVVVSAKFKERPDLLSNELYGTPNLWWVFIIRNPDALVDPIFDLTEGTELFVPSQARLFSLLGL